MPTARAGVCRFVPIVALDDGSALGTSLFGLEVAIDSEPHVRLTCAIGALLAARAAHPDRRPAAIMVPMSLPELERVDVGSLAATLVPAGIPLELLMIRVPSYTAGTPAPALERVAAAGVTVVVGGLIVPRGARALLAGAPVDVIELPPALVDDVDRSLTSEHLVDEWLALAHGVDWLVLARNVRRPGQADLLQRLGCDLVAGPLIGAPVEPGQLAAGACAHGAALVG